MTDSAKVGIFMSITVDNKHFFHETKENITHKAVLLLI